MLNKFSQGPPGLVNRLNALIDVVNRLQGQSGDSFIQQSNVVPGRSQRLGVEPLIPRIPRMGGGVAIRIFEVQSVATGDGVYNCYQQTLDATEWADTAGDDRFDDKGSFTTWSGAVTYSQGDRVIHNGVVYESLQDSNLNHEPPNATWWVVKSVEILNLLENHVESSYTRGLARYDRMQCWRWTDDEGTSRWVGVPLTPHSRRFKCTESATANDHITCNVILNNGNEASSSADILYNIEVYCDIHDGGVLNAAAPRLISGEYLLAQHNRGKWICTTVFEDDIECVCTAP